MDIVSIWGVELEGSGAKVILEGSNKVMVKQSLQFEFRASNNQAEYEELLARMKLARELGTQVLTTKSNSQLVTLQVNKEYEAKDPHLMKYWDRARKQAVLFEKFTLIHVLRTLGLE
ncbi:rnhA, partial [Mucuna pruriens]